MTIHRSNQIRGMMKTFGRLVPKGTGRITQETCARVVLENRSSH
jgi:hypothetical protein